MGLNHMECQSTPKSTYPHIKAQHDYRTSFRRHTFSVDGESLVSVTCLFCVCKKDREGFREGQRGIKYL